MALSKGVQEVLDRITEAATTYLAAKNGTRVKAAHELRKAANRLYAVEKPKEKAS